jgi:hypothetical protein
MIIGAQNGLSIPSHMQLVIVGKSVVSFLFSRL